MINWIKQYKKASSETKQFVWTFAITLLIILGTAGFAYARLDSSRSSSPQETKELDRQLERQSL